MKRNYFLFAPLLAIALFYLSACCKHDPPIDPQDPCDTPQIGFIKDLTGLDGCGMVIVLGDKTLEPVGTDLKAKGFKDGEPIQFAYEPVNALSICMVGQTVNILCINSLQD